MENKNIFAALVAASAEIKNARRDANNPAFRSSYATLESVLGEVRPTFARHGLALVQLPGAIVDRAGKACVQLTTLVVHTSGEQIGHVAEAPLGDKATAQAYGSAITYLRRYAAQSVAGIAPTDDDDGNAASGHAPPAPARPSPAPSPSPASNRDPAEVVDLIEKIGRIPDLTAYAAFRSQVQDLMPELDDATRTQVARAMAERRQALTRK